MRPRAVGKRMFLGLPPMPGAVDIGVKVGFQIVMAWHLVALAAFLMQAHPCAAFLHIDIFNPHLKSRADPGKCVDHQGN